MKYKVVKGLRRYNIPNSIATALFSEAAKALPNTYPKPNQVACALLTVSSNIYQGVDYRTQIMSLTMHAEATALANAVIHGDKEVIAITGENCHACKQLLWENAIHFGNDIIILIKEEKRIRKVALSKIMLYAFPKNHWEK